MKFSTTKLLTTLKSSVNKAKLILVKCYYFLKQYYIVFLQYAIPKHLLSRLVFSLSRINNRTIYKISAKWMVQKYNIDLSIANKENILDYSCLNDLFTRSLKKVHRPIGDGFVSPVDGLISHSGEIINNTIIQAKNKFYTVDGLLADSKYKFNYFATIYLAPYDYHRVHAPLSGKLLTMEYIGGDLFSVNQKTVVTISNLFTQNERVICHFDSFTIVLVGAIFVGSIEVVWHGMVTPPYGKSYSIDYADKNITINKGDEIGKFNMGSTVIVLNNHYQLNQASNAKVVMGERLDSHAKK